MDEGALHELLGRKWTVRLLLALREEPRGFGELERALGVTSKPLAERLAALRCRGFLERSVHATTPPTTTYRLTDRGAAFADRLAALDDLVAVVDCDCPPATAAAWARRVPCPPPRAGRAARRRGERRTTGDRAPAARPRRTGRVGTARRVRDSPTTLA